MNTTTTTTTINNAMLDDTGKLLMRATLAILILFHGYAKLAGGIGFISGMVTGAGLPGVIAYLVYVGEVVAPLLVLFGIWTRAGALVIAGNMLVAIFLAHAGEIFAINETGGWAIELQGMFLFTAIAVVLLGAGRYGVQSANHRWN